MNEEIKRKADELFAKTRRCIPATNQILQTTIMFLAISSVQNTISVLKQMDNEIYNIEPYLDEQTAILKELESRI